MSNLIFYTMFKEANAPVKIFTIKGYNHTMDMSVSNTSESQRLILGRKLDNVSYIDNMSLSCCGRTDIVSVSPDKVVVKWSREEFEIALGSEVTTSCRLLNNPHLSLDEVYMKYEYKEIDTWEMMTDLNDWIIQYHKKNSHNTYYCNDEQEMLLQLIYDQIERGEVGLYPLYALYKSATNWYTMKITDYKLFNEIMQEGMSNGCLSESIISGVINFAQLIKHNPLNEMYAHVPHLEENIQLLADAGNETAINICNGSISYKEKTSRENPNKNELIMTITADVNNNPELKKSKPTFIPDENSVLTKEDWDEIFFDDLNYSDFNTKYRTDERVFIFTEAEMRNNATLSLDDLGELRIVEVKDDKLNLSWKDKVYNVKEIVGLVVKTEIAPLSPTRPDEFIRLTIKLNKSNIWSEIRHHISLVTINQVSTNPLNKLSIESTKQAVLKLIKQLMEREGDNLDELYDILAENENWRIVNYDGEKRYLLE